MRVDAHQHFWRYTEEEFGWIDERMASIRRDFVPADLAPLLAESRVSATVAVQARQSLEETLWLLELADQYPWIAGVVGWVPLASPRAGETLEQFSSHSKFKGVRHVLQGEVDAYMDGPDFNAGIALLQDHSLTYDLLVLDRQLPTAIQLVDRHQRQLFVLDHLAKPAIAAREIEPWRGQIRELARRPHVACKLSGMVTEADLLTWTIEDLRPFVETVVEAFGPTRVLFGSDWPVCTVASSYARWMETLHSLLCELSVDEQDAVFGGNARNLYRLQEQRNSVEVISA